MPTKVTSQNNASGSEMRRNAARAAWIAAQRAAYAPTAADAACDLGRLMEAVERLTHAIAIERSQERDAERDWMPAYLRELTASIDTYAESVDGFVAASTEARARIASGGTGFAEAV